MEFRILGPLEVLEDGHEVNIGGVKQRALLAALLLDANRAVTVDRLIEALWGEQPPKTAAKALQVYVSRLRKALGRNRIVTTSAGYRVAVLPGELDLERFQTLTAEGKLEEALALWRGAVLADLAYGQFSSETGRLEELRLACLEQRIDRDLASGLHDALIAELEALVREHPHRERLRGQLMLAFYRAGRQAEALDAYQDAYRALNELGVEPSRSLRELQQSILNQDPELSVAKPRDESRGKLATGAGALPVWLTPLRGRSRELAEICSLVRGDARLLTLTGPGGTGKTRLAAAIARELAPSFDDGARFVALAPLTDPGLVLPSIARALGVRPEGGNELTALKDALEGRNLLLVLDNFEHVLEAAPAAGELAAACEGLRVLATSRAPLRVDGERLWPVDPLELPAANTQPEPEQLERHAAVTLFTERARAVQPTFTLDEENAGAVAEICIKLDGLPLAIELAAGRVTLLPPAAMVDRLDRTVPFLGAGPRHAPERQRTLEKAIGWSYDLLTDRQRKLFRALSAFAGSWTVEAAEAVGDASLDDIGALVEINLLRSAHVGDEQRFSMLRTIREFAHDRLAETDEAAAAIRRHAEYMLAFAREAEVELRSPKAAVWLTRLEIEHDNMRAALASSLESADRELALRLAVSLWPFWYTHGHFAEGSRWLRLCLESVAEPEPELLAAALGGASRLAFLLGDLVEARALAERSLHILREQGDLVRVQDALGALAIVLSAQGELDGAEQLRHEALELARQRGDRHREALHVLNLGYYALVRGDVAQAEPLLRQSVEAYAEIGEHEAEAFALMNLALMEFHEERFDEALRLIAVSLQTGMLVGSKQSLAYGIECVAAVAASRGQATDAARLLASGERLRDEIGLSLQPYEQALHDRTTSLVEVTLDDNQLARERESGRALTLDESYAYALAVCEVLAPRSTDSA